ncbi:MAG: glycosyltransferase family 2 protein [Patescibacteria group bacterium]
MNQDYSLDVSIVIVNFNTKNITLNCLSSVIESTQGVQYELIVVDNASTDGSIEAITKFDTKGIRLKFIKNLANVGFAAGNNQGTKEAGGKYILFLNSDTLVKNNVVKNVFDHLEANSKLGAAGVKIVGVDGNIQEAGGYFPTLTRVFSWMTIQDLPFVDGIIKPFHPLKKKSFTKNVGFFEKQQKLDWLIGAFMFVRKSVLDQVKGWDEDYFMYTEDVDLCYKIKNAGYEIVYLPDLQITHLGGASSASSEFPLVNEYKGIKTFYKKHYPVWQFPILRLMLKIGALGRMILFAILEGRQTAHIYAKAFKTA